ncbi:hypothetical protein [Chthonobacter albigriseus]|uniref:hypothetical protein n=1 Tax=Chthonobacter albigriseus TaxID=1683161 RepID=UPI0015EF77D2|nr:hypothetical protein [Chthonobacter albigriseus]
MPRSGHRAYRVFLIRVAAWCFAFIAGYAGLLAALNWARALPPPPFTGTECLDEKFVLLRNAELADRDLITVGSSVTWRNLDFREVEQRLAVKPFNTAPCYLYTSQAAFFADVLLANLPQVRTVLTVVAPRDFEVCDGPVDAFADRTVLEGFIFGRDRFEWIYGANLRPVSFAESVIRRWTVGGGPGDKLAMDEYGSSFLKAKQAWEPPPVVDPDCMDGMAALETVVNARGARLIVVSFPLSPSWSKRFNPGGRFIAGFEREIRGRLKNPSTLFIGSDAFEGTDDDYADAVHLLAPAVPRFTRALVDRLDPAVL